MAAKALLSSLFGLVAHCVNNADCLLDILFNVNSSEFLTLYSVLNKNNLRSILKWFDPLFKSDDVQVLTVAEKLLEMLEYDVKVFLNAPTFRHSLEPAAHEFWRKSKVSKTDFRIPDPDNLLDKPCTFSAICDTSDGFLCIDQFCNPIALTFDQHTRLKSIHTEVLKRLPGSTFSSKFRVLIKHSTWGQLLTVNHKYLKLPLKRAAKLLVKGDPPQLPPSYCSRILDNLSVPTPEQF